jgi:hypothetical protein
LDLSQSRVTADLYECPFNRLTSGDTMFSPEGWATEE